MNKIIYGKFTSRGPLSEVKPSRDEDARMMRQMMFRPEGLKNDTLILMDPTVARIILLDERVWVEVRKADDLWLAQSFGYELED